MRSQIRVKRVGGIAAMIVGGALLTGCLHPADEIVIKQDGVGAIVFVKQNSVAQRNNNSPMAANPSEFYRGTDIYKLSPISSNGRLTNLTAAWTRGTRPEREWGAAEDPEISYDGRKMLFSMRRAGNSSWRIFELDLESGVLAQLTNPASGDDMDPAYLPSGDIVFTSTRNGMVDEYERRPAPQLFLGMRNGGTGPVETSRQLSFNQSHDQNPFVHSSGRIFFTRWDHLGSPNKMPLFSIHPDGTRQFVLYGADETFAPATGLRSGMRVFMEAREMRDLGIVSSLMERTSPFEGGAICIIDLSKGISAPPEIITPSNTPYNFAGRDMVATSLFKTPYPVMDGTKERLLVAQSAREAGEGVSGQANFDLFVMDKDGRNVQVIHVDPDFNDYDPVVVAPHSKPKDMGVNPDVAKGLSGQATTGFFFDANVYSRDRTLDNQPIPAPGEIRYLRVLEGIPLPRSNRGGEIGDTDFEKQRVIGYADVESDGSFAIEVPALKSLHVQTLDRNGVMVVNQLQWIHVQPGERRICTGCHGPREKDADIDYFDILDNGDVKFTRDQSKDYLASFARAQKVWTHAAARPDTFDFYDARAIESGSPPARTATVQSALNRSCMPCHSAAAPAGGLNLAEDTAAAQFQDQGISKVYRNLTRDSAYVAAGQTRATMAYVSSRGTRNSPLGWVLFNKQLNGSSNAQYRAPSHDHSALWKKDADGNVEPFAPENRNLLTLIEWMDMGAQFSNTIGY